jgi:NADPH:quinone reductase
MKAVIVREFTDFDRAEYTDAPEPKPRPGEVVVELEASDTNFPDLLFIEGKYQSRPALPFTPGLGGAGKISAIADGVRDWSVGDKVLVLPHYGTYSEKIAVNADFCFPMPEEMDFYVAAALGLVYQTAYFALVERAAFSRGDCVLVLGASGGVGMAAVQLAKALGARKVIAATRGPQGAQFVADLGADFVVDSSMDNIRGELRSAVYEGTENRGVDIVIDPVGGEIGAAALRALAWCGRHVVVGFASGTVPSFAANYLLVKNISVSGLQWTDYRAHRLNDVRRAQKAIFEFWRSGALTPQIERVLPLSAFREALALLNQGSATGKLILKTKGH